jgi:hypothetical protein
LVIVPVLVKACSVIVLLLLFKGEPFVAKFGIFENLCLVCGLQLCLVLWAHFFQEEEPPVVGRSRVDNGDVALAERKDTRCFQVIKLIRNNGLR